MAQRLYTCTEAVRSPPATLLAGPVTIPAASPVPLAPNNMGETVAVMPPGQLDPVQVAVPEIAPVTVAPVTGLMKVRVPVSLHPAVVAA